MLRNVQSINFVILLHYFECLDSVPQYMLNAWIYLSFLILKTIRNQKSSNIIKYK